MSVEARNQNGYLQIGEVAERTGVTQRTLRFYEEKGLLKPPTRMEGGFRLYSEEDVRRVERIRQLQSLLGFALAEIKEMVEAEEIKGQIHSGWSQEIDADEQRARILRALELTDVQRSIITQKIAQLQQMQQGLESRIGAYHGWLAQLDAAEAASRQSS